jgi:hypothetical protein
MKNNYFIGIMYIMVETRRGTKTTRVERKKVVKKSMWDIGPINKKKFKGSKFRKGVEDIEDLGYATARGVKGVGYAGVRAAEGVEHEVESGLTGLERGLRGLTVNKVEDEMSELQNRMSKLGGARTKRRRHKTRARSTKKR